MEQIFTVIKQAYQGYYRYLMHEISTPQWNNYFYWLIALSLFFWILEIRMPWRKNQAVVRKDFWLDAFYMFFNFFLFNLFFFIAFSNTTVYLFDRLLHTLGTSVAQLQIVDLQSLGLPLALIAFFLVSDFVQWVTHLLLHRIPWLWNFHKVHHSVKEMGFAAHLRYHWMETLVYRTMLYLPLAIIGGFEVKQVFLVHIIALCIGHFNHSNIHIPLGPLKYVFNNPQMHIWHHAKHLPASHPFGMNFGISLSIWDYLFRTNYMPHSGKDIELGFEKDEYFPKDFIRQELYPLSKHQKE
ncbi:MAG: sterol desaturase family protein [Flavobacteriaceae bacterium]|nr:sterol desaturase family protein [Flavobacteriaceae bacterium]